jgi:tetratricopeptide (TPR) repeat protein
LEKAQSLISLEALYNEATQKKLAGDLVGALATFQEIENQYPNYRDVTLQSKDIQRQFTLDDLIKEADIAIQAGEWEKAVSDYEQVRNRDFSYQTEIVEQRLYYSYLNAAQELLIDQPDSLEALTTAQGYYSKALSLKPQDTTVIEELETARTTIGNRLFNKFIELAQQSLIGQPDSIEGLKTAEEYLSKASAIRPSDVLVARKA